MLPADGPSGPGVLAGSSCSGRWPTGDTGQYPVRLPHRGQVLPHLSLSSASSCPPGACVHSQADLRISGKPEGQGHLACTPSFASLSFGPCLCPEGRPPPRALAVQGSASVCPLPGQLEGQGCHASPDPQRPWKRCFCWCSRKNALVAAGLARCDNSVAKGDNYPHGVAQAATSSHFQSTANHGCRLCPRGLFSDT